MGCEQVLIPSESKFWFDIATFGIIFEIYDTVVWGGSNYGAQVVNLAYAVAIDMI